MHAAEWGKLDDMPRERSQSQETACCMIPFIRNTQSRQTQKDRLGVDQKVDWGLPKAWEKGELVIWRDC